MTTVINYVFGANMSVAFVPPSSGLSNVDLAAGVFGAAWGEPSMIHKLVDLQFAGFSDDADARRDALDVEREFAASDWEAWRLGDAD